MNREKIINDLNDLIKIEKESSELNPDDYNDFREYLKYRDLKRNKKFNDIGFSEIELNEFKSGSLNLPVHVQAAN